MMGRREKRIVNSARGEKSEWLQSWEQTERQNAKTGGRKNKTQKKRRELAILRNKEEGGQEQSERLTLKKASDEAPKLTARKNECCRTA